jgi:hypothetical protein
MTSAAGASSPPAREDSSRQTSKPRCDSAHHKSIGVCGSAGESSDEQWRRGHGGGAATASNST